MARAPGAKAAPRRRRSTPAARTRGGIAGIDRPALLLLAVWALYRLYPYVPTLSLSKYWHAILPVLMNPLPHGSDPARLGLMWLLCCMLTEAAAGPVQAIRLFPMVAGAIFAARVLIGGTALSSADIAGACVAYGLWRLVFRRAPGRNGILAAFIAALLVTMRLTPFGFGWPALLEKAYLYGGLIWLLHRAGLRLQYAALATALLLTAFAVTGTNIRVHPAALGDAGLALAAGAALYGAGFSRSGRSRP